MFLYTRNFWRDNCNKVNTRAAYNLNMYTQISIATKDKCDIIAEALDSSIHGEERFLVAEIPKTNEGFVFALLDVNEPEMLQKLFDDIIKAISENRSVYYVDDFYKENHLY